MKKIITLLLITLITSCGSKEENIQVPNFTPPQKKSPDSNDLDKKKRKDNYSFKRQQVEKLQTLYNEHLVESDFVEVKSYYMRLFMDNIDKSWAKQLDEKEYIKLFKAISQYDIEALF